MPFGFADSNLYFLAVMSCNCCIIGFLSSVSPSTESSNQRMVLGPRKKNVNNTSWKLQSGEFLRMHTGLMIKHVRYLYLLDKNELAEGTY